jgi:hypothetical protein
VLLGYGLVAAREGPTRLGDYLFRILPAWNAGYLHEPTNLSPARLGHSIFVDQPLSGQLVAIGIVATGLFVVWWSAAPDRPIRFALGIATAAALVVNPVVWTFYVVLALLPIANALGVLRTHSDAPTMLALVAVIALPFLSQLAGVTPDSSAFFILGMLAAASTMLLAVATVHALEPAGRPPVVAQSAFVRRNQ